MRDYAGNRSEAAFTELVRRHMDFVYSAALRMVCDPHLAEDVTQSVFVALGRSATQLAERAILSGWLHRTAQNIAAQTVRTIERRRIREQEAVAMNQLLSAESDANWEHISPHLDDALGNLSEPDRDALLLRYFERKSAHEMAQILGISDAAAQKRVSRAVDRLRETFAKRGITVGASGLVVIITANAVQAAPVGLAVTISAAAAHAGTILASTTTATAIKTIAMTTLQKTLIATIIVAAVGTGVYKARQTSTFPGQSQASFEARCLENLRIIAGARQQYALEHKLALTNMVTTEQILPYILSHQLPQCPSGGTYTFARLTNAPICSIPGHVLTPLPEPLKTAAEQAEYQALSEAIDSYKRNPNGPAPKEFPKELDTAWKSYHAKNPGQTLTDLYDLEPYTKTPEEVDALHELIDSLKR